MTAMPMTIPSTAMSTMGRTTAVLPVPVAEDAACDEVGKPMPMTATKLAACLALMAVVSLFTRRSGIGAVASEGHVRSPTNTSAWAPNAWRSTCPCWTAWRVAVVSNQTGLVAGTHLVDTLLARGVRLVRVFAPSTVSAAK